jgi:signal peptidase I
MGKSIFINRTTSMPLGIYLKQAHEGIKKEDIIVFNVNVFDGNLIKNVAAIFPGEFCIDENAFFWVDGIPLAQKNIEKYPDNNLNQSICQMLKPDELLVLGDHPDSYDSRYFGPIKKSDVIASVKLIWSFQ